jgi:hypothetical protein
MSLLDKVVWTQATRIHGMCVARILPGFQEALRVIYCGGTGSILSSQYVMRMLYDSLPLWYVG